MLTAVLNTISEKFKSHNKLRSCGSVDVLSGLMLREQEGRRENASTSAEGG